MVFFPLSLVGTKLPDEPLRRNFRRNIPTCDFLKICVYIYIYIYMYIYIYTYIYTYAQYTSGIR